MTSDRAIITVGIHHQRSTRSTYSPPDSWLTRCPAVAEIADRTAHDAVMIMITSMFVET